MNPWTPGGTVDIAIHILQWRIRMLVMGGLDIIFLRRRFRQWFIPVSLGGIGFLVPRAHASGVACCIDCIGTRILLWRNVIRIHFDSLGSGLCIRPDCPPHRRLIVPTASPSPPRPMIVRAHKVHGLGQRTSPPATRRLQCCFPSVVHMLVRFFGVPMYQEPR
jgi:hypothetical protein